MRIWHEFTVDRASEQVWQAFQDIPSIAQCLPGAEVTESRGDDVYAGAVTVKLGPITALFEGEADVAFDHGARTIQIAGKGTDRRGGSRGSVTVLCTVAPGPAEATAVTVDADVVLAGPAAQFGRQGLIDDISKRLIDQFVACLETKLAAATAEDAAAVKAVDVNGIALFLRGLWGWITRTLKRTP